MSNFLKLVLTLTSSFTLMTGCGFTPLLSERQELQGIKIEVIAERSGQELRNHLLDMLTPKGTPVHPLYNLKIEIKESTRDLQFYKDATAGRGEISIVADLSLKDNGTQKVIFTQKTESSSSYGIDSASDFASLTYEKDAKSRTLKVLAEQIKLQVASFFAARRAPQP